MQRDLGRFERDSFDLIVVGGGIYGACVAWDAVLRGLSVALLEKEDFGHATSANSLKTIHGGLRYLQQLDLKRMRESIRERTTLMRIAPHLVHPLAFLMPTYGHSLKGREAMAAALLIDDLISFDRNRRMDPQKHLPRGRTISRKDCLKLVPGLEKDGLTGGAIWYDGQLYNSERLTLSFLRSAANAGAIVANYVKVIDFLAEQTRVVGVRAVDALDGNQIEVRARTVVNAAGPWVDQVLDTFHGNTARPRVGVRFAKAINLVTRPLFDSYAVGLPARNESGDSGRNSKKSHRLLFVAPWRDRSLVGTAYTPFDGRPEQLRVTEPDIRAFMEEVNRACPTVELKRADIEHIHVGLVPISGMDPESGTVRREGRYRIRDHRVEGIEGLISVLGVKYTTARGVAEKVVDRVFQSWGHDPPASRSATTPLHGGGIARFADFVASELRKRPNFMAEDTLRPLLYNYGSDYPEVLSTLDRHTVPCPKNSGWDDHSAHNLGAGAAYRPFAPTLQSDTAVDVERPLTDTAAVLRSETIHATRREMAQKLADVVFRRTELGSAGSPDANTLAFCATVMASELGWSPARVQRELQEVNAAFAVCQPW